MTPFIGQIMMFGGNFAPRGWATCDGQLLAISQYSALFSILGTTYGGDGVTTFGLPDMRGRFPMHEGRGPGLTPASLGAKRGRENVTLTVNELPAHNHAANALNSTGSSINPGSNLPAQGQIPNYGSGAANAKMANDAIGNTGGGRAFSIEPPSQVVTFCIALEGIYPSRS